MTGLFLGMDAGSTATKGVLLDDRSAILATAQAPSGIDFGRAAMTVIERLRAAAEGERDATVRCCVACGYGRHSVTAADATKTEIACHARGSFHHIKSAHTLVDIGGQDTKVIRVDGSGTAASFELNRKCAAGTGAFLEEMARRMRIRLDDMPILGSAGQKPAPISSYCTVFAASEMLAAARRGTAPEDIALGVYQAMAERTLALVGSPGQRLVLSGGVAANNPIFCRIVGAKSKGALSVPPLSQYNGAVGAALFAAELYHRTRRTGEHNEVSR